jgi:probable F420-dependent oxidoreductase
MRVSIGIPTWGEAPEEHGYEAIVGACLEAEVDGLWIGDHVTLSRNEDRRYPYSPDGEFFLAPDDNWYESLTALGYIAAFSKELELGTGVLLPTLRPPALLAKQVATLERLAGGEVVLGVGAGWLKTEFDAVDVPFEKRGRRLEDHVRVVREYWTGEPTPGEYGAYTVPEGVTSYPVPARTVPILIGGNSDAAMRRAARVGDGWIGALGVWDGGEQELAGHVERLRAIWQEHAPGGSVPQHGVVVAVPGSLGREPDCADQIAARLIAMRALGMERVVLNLGWRSFDRTRQMLDQIRQAVARARAADVPEPTTTQGA